MYIIFDTETTGLPKNWDAPASDSENWPRMVQIAWMSFDESGNEISRECYIIKPEGFTIPNDVIRIHGITTEIAEKKGIPLEVALKRFSEAVSLAKILVAHNIEFDEKIVEAEFLRKEFPTSLSGIKKMCTMKPLKEFCKIEGPYGYKWPSLSELHKKLFNKDFVDAHDASVDVKICAKCFFELKKLGVIK